MRPTNKKGTWREFYQKQTLKNGSFDSELCDDIVAIVNGADSKPRNRLDAFLLRYPRCKNETQLKELKGYLIGNTTIDDLTSFFSKTSGKRGRPKKDTSVSKNDFENHNDIELDNDNKTNFMSENSEKNSDRIDTPFDEPVIERGYTQGSFIKQDDADAETVESEDYENENENKHETEYDDNSYEYEDDDIPEPEYREISEDETDESEQLDDESESGKLSDNLDDLSPAQKKKAAEKTADVILNVYGAVAPLPFKYFSKFNEVKIADLSINGMLDLNLKLDGNTTVREYIDTVNTTVDEIMTFDDETREDIREPLVEVLMEKGLALTPTQRLMFAVGQHLFVMASAAASFYKQNAIALKQFQSYTTHQSERGTTKSRANKTSKPNPTKVNLTANITDSEREQADRIMKDMGYIEDEDFDNFDDSEG